MDAEFHYYINFLIARFTGIDEDTAYKIAYSAQFVDDNTIMYDVYDSATKKKIFSNIITQSYNISLPKQILYNIYPPFHFVPSFNESYKWQTCPDNKLSNALLDYALSYKCPYLLGIASHAYCDTYAHQGFSGRLARCNTLFNTGLVKTYGHTMFLELPDKINEVWFDSRSMAMVHNNKRFLRCVGKLISKYHKLSLLPPNQYKQMKRLLICELKSVFNSKVYKRSYKRIKAYSNIYKKYFGSSIKNYDVNAYKDSCFYWSCSTQKYVAKHGFINSDWIKFQFGAKLYLKKYKIFLKRLRRAAKDKRGI